MTKLQDQQSIKSVWVIGKPLAGKSTLARLLVEKIRSENRQCLLLDGDEVRNVFDNKLGYDRNSRRKQTRRMMRLARLVAKGGTLPVVAMIHPFLEDRQNCRETISGYFQIALECDFKELIRRDGKKLYLPALRNERKNVVGVDITFDPPVDSDLTLQSDVLSPEESLDAVWQQIALRI